MNRKLIVILSIIGIIILAFVTSAALSNMKPKEEKKEKEDIKRYVNAVNVKYSDINSQFKETGRVSSRSSIDLSPEVRGKIIQASVILKKGQSFKKGQLLLKIYNEEAKLALQSQKSRFLNSLANILPDLKTDFKSSYNNWLSFFEEVDIKKSIPKLPEIKSNKEKIFLSSRNILADYYSIKSSEITLSKYYLYAPFNGSFTAVYSEIGAIANPGVRIASMIRTDKLELEIPVELENIKFIKKGQTVDVISPSNNNIFKGRISRIADFVDNKTQSVSVFIDISAENNSAIYQGEYMTVVFSDITLKNALEIPRDAVFNQNKVFTVVNGKLKKETVNILKMNENTIIINGLEEGEILVTEALINAVDNMEVEILK